MHQWMTTTVDRTSRRRVTIAAPLQKPAWPRRWQPWSFRAHASKDQGPRATTITIRTLNLHEVPDTKSHRRVRTARNPNIAAQKTSSKMMHHDLSKHRSALRKSIYKLLARAEALGSPSPPPPSLILGVHQSNQTLDYLPKADQLILLFSSCLLWMDP